MSCEKKIKLGLRHLLARGNGWLLKLCQMRFFHFFVARSLPDCCQIVARLGGPPCQIYFLCQIFRFPKKSGTGVRTPVPDSGNYFQIARLCQILVLNSYVASTIIVWRVPKTQGINKKKDSSSSLHCCRRTCSHRRSQQSPPPSPLPLLLSSITILSSLSPLPPQLPPLLPCCVVVAAAATVAVATVVVVL